MTKMDRKQYRRLRERRIRRLLFILLLWQMQGVNREYWVHPVNALRPIKGEFYNLYPDLRHFPQRFVGMYRMDPSKFDELLRKVSPLIKKKCTYMRTPISPEQKLVLTLR